MYTVIRANQFVGVTYNSISQAIFTHHTGMGEMILPVSTPPQDGAVPTQEDIEAATSWTAEYGIDCYIDSVAQAKGYDSRITAALRAGYSNPWQAEGAAFGAWMDGCYTHCYQVETDVRAGLRPIPTLAEIIAELPAMEWPE